MIISIVSHKGGVGKTTTAIHLSSWLAEKEGSSLLIDGDPNQSALGWSQRGDGLPTGVMSERQAALDGAKNFKHRVLDTQARPSEEDFEVLAQISDLILIPVTPEALPLDALGMTIQKFQKHGMADRVRILLTIVPPFPNRDGEVARAELTSAGLQVFDTEIPRAVAVARAPASGCLVRDLKDEPRAQELWKLYCHLGKEVLSHA